MGDVSVNRPIKAESPADGIAKGSRILDMMSAGWTDERHMMYISSMEASFIEQFYGHEQHTHSASRSGSYGNRFKRTNASMPGTNGCSLPTNPWIRHLRPCNAGSNLCGDGMKALVDDDESGTQMIRGRIRVHSREMRGCGGENLAGKSAEVSDQNFANEEAEVDLEPSKPCKKRRSSSRSTTVPYDQVVPSGKSDSLTKIKATVL